MPKIINDLRGKLMNATREIITENGYCALTVRTLAAMSGIGLGTIYNYFPSKAGLLTELMLTDWNITVDGINAAIERDASRRAVIYALCSGVEDYLASHDYIFTDPEAEKAFSVSDSSNKYFMIDNLVGYIKPLCKKREDVDRTDIAKFIAESIFSWVKNGRDYHDLYPVIKILLNE